MHKDDDDVELHEEALSNGEEDLIVAAMVQSLRDEVFNNGEATAGEKWVEGLRPLKALQVISTKLTRFIWRAPDSSLRPVIVQVFVL